MQKIVHQCQLIHHIGVELDNNEVLKFNIYGVCVRVMEKYFALVTGLHCNCDMHDHNSWYGDTCIMNKVCDTCDLEKCNSYPWKKILYNENVKALKGLLAKPFPREEQNASSSHDLKSFFLAFQVKQHHLRVYIHISIHTHINIHTCIYIYIFIKIALLLSVTNLDVSCLYCRLCCCRCGLWRQLPT